MAIERKRRSVISDQEARKGLHSGRRVRREEGGDRAGTAGGVEVWFGGGVDAVKAAASRRTPKTWMP